MAQLAGYSKAWLAECGHSYIVRDSVGKATTAAERFSQSPTMGLALTLCLDDDRARAQAGT